MTSQKKKMTGVVVSDKMDKTVVVRVTRLLQSRRVEKFFERRKKFKAHDELNACKTGDLVSMQECPPISREKRWEVVKILQKGGMSK